MIVGIFRLKWPDGLGCGGGRGGGMVTIWMCVGKKRKGGSDDGKVIGEGEGMVEDGTTWWIKRGKSDDRKEVGDS